MATAKGQVHGYAQSTAQYVLSVTFGATLSSKIKYECYDGGSYPAVGNNTTTDYDIFQFGVLPDYSANYSMIALHDTTNGPPSAAEWYPSAVQSNTASLNLMKGIVSYVTQAGSTMDPTAAAPAASCFYNMMVSIPASAQTAYDMGFDLLARFTYTGAVPVVTFWFNNKSDSGTGLVPVWATIPAGTRGVTHSRTGFSIGDSVFLANIPSTGTEYTADSWITN